MSGDNHNQADPCTTEDHEAFEWFKKTTHRPHLIMCAKCGKTDEPIPIFRGEVSS